MCDGSFGAERRGPGAKAPLIIVRSNQKGSAVRMFVKGVLEMCGLSFARDLPEAFGEWSSVFPRFSGRSIKAVWWWIFDVR